MGKNEDGETASKPIAKPYRRLALASRILVFAPLAILLVGALIAIGDDSDGAPAMWLVFMVSIFLVPLACLALASWVGVAVGRSRLNKGKKFWPAYLITLIGFSLLLVVIPNVLTLLEQAGIIRLWL